MPSKRQYTKNWLSFDDQVALLQKRGLIVENKDAAASYLSFANYYRFSGYCLAFQGNLNESGERVFIDGTKFEDVQKMCVFDRRLRDALSDALELVEIALRCDIAYNFSRIHGAFGHIDPQNFIPDFSASKCGYPSKFSIWKNKIIEETKRSKELFVRHYRETYQEYPDLPLWIMSELCSFGSLSVMLNHMTKSDLRIISANYRLQPCVLTSWVHSFTYLRNVCAHHSRLWDKYVAIKPMIPLGKKWDILRTKPESIFTATVLLNWTLGHIAIDESVHRQWIDDIVAIYSDIFTNFPQFKKRMRFDIEINQFKALLNNAHCQKSTHAMTNPNPCNWV